MNYRPSSSVVTLRQFLKELCLFWNLEYRKTQFSAVFSCILWYIKLKCCTWLCFNVLQSNFECCHFASIFEGVMPLQARIQKFLSGGGPTFWKILTSKKKPTTKREREGEREDGFSIYSALVWLKSIFAIETALQTIIFYKYDIVRCFLQAKHIRGDCLSFVKWVSDITGGVSGGPPPPPRKKWFKWSKIV